MARLITSEDGPCGSRRDYWRHVMSAALGPVDLAAGGDDDVPDRLILGEAGAVQVAELIASRPNGATRTATHVRHADPGLYKIDVPVRGAVDVEQGGRRTRLTPGDFALVDLSRPARWTSVSTRNIALIFPKQLLPLPPDEVAKLTAVRIPGDCGPGAVMSSLAVPLARRLDEWDPSSRARLGNTVIDLLAVALATRLDRNQLLPGATRQQALRLHIDRFIESHLDDADLSPAGIASAHHISIRYLYKLFESQNAGVAGLIRERRLARCRRDLLDPALQNVPVSSIGARHGFTDASSFSRSFRTRFGAPPAEYRRSVDGM